jgi:hypothetical protein
MFDLQVALVMLAEREGFFLRFATKALRDNEPWGSHRSLSNARKLSPCGT